MYEEEDLQKNKSQKENKLKIGFDIKNNKQKFEKDISEEHIYDIKKELQKNKSQEENEPFIEFDIEFPITFSDFDNSIQEIDE